MKDDRVYLFHIRDAIERTLQYTRGGHDAFLAVVRNLEVIGEATKNISPSLRDANQDVPWKQIAGTRDRVIHRYFEVDLAMVWKVSRSFVPFFNPKARAIRSKASLGGGGKTPASTLQ